MISQVHHWCTFDFIVKIIPGRRPGLVSWVVQKSLLNQRICSASFIRPLCGVLCPPVENYTFGNLNVVCIIGKAGLVAGFRWKQQGASRHPQGQDGCTNHLDVYMPPIMQSAMLSGYLMAPHPLSPSCTYAIASCHLWFHSYHHYRYILILCTS